MSSKSKVIQALEDEQMSKEVPAFAPGDTIVVQPSPRPEALDRLGPIVFGPCTGGPDHPGHVKEVFADDRALTAVEWFGDQEADVRIAPPLAQDRDQLPEP